MNLPHYIIQFLFVKLAYYFLVTRILLPFNVFIELYFALRK